MRFENKAVLITGAGSGLGRATALQLAKEGASLFLVDVNGSSLEETGRLIRELSPDREVTLATADVTDEKVVHSFVTDMVRKYEAINGFFNNAGIEGETAPTADCETELFHRILDVNLNGVFYGLKHVLAVMREQGFGSVVNMSSVGGIRGMGNYPSYSASKHGVVGLTRNAAVEYGQFGVRINAVAPGAIMTPMVEETLKRAAGDRWQEVGEEFVSANPMKRFGKPEEVAYLVAFLLSDESEFINAATITIDGGQSYKY